MTTITTSNMFYLGNLTQTDTTEGNYFTENASAILGAYSKPPIVSITNVDQDDNGAIRDDEDNPNGDYIAYDAGAGATSQFVDSSVYYFADVLLGDGSILSIELMVIQSQNGDAFAVDLNATNDLENQAIQSITLTSVSTDGFGGHLTSNTINGASTVCFCLGTQISTAGGEVPVESLQVGDLVRTLDHGLQPVIWTNHTVLMRPGTSAPITFERGSLGQGVPSQRLRVSPHHRLLVRSKIAERIFGEPEVFVAAKDFLSQSQTEKALPFLPTTYCHFACKNHEVVFANGAEAETFLLGRAASNMLSKGARQSLLAQRPSVEPARKIVRGPKVRSLMRRHSANDRAFCTAA